MTKIVCLGDSLTYGYPYGPEASWVTYVANMLLELQLVNAGVNGDTLEDMAARFSSAVLHKQPEAVIILGGTNDAFCGEVTGAQSRYYLEQMLNQAGEHQIRTVLAIPMPVDDPFVGPKLGKIICSIREQAQSRQLLQLDFWTPFIDSVTGLMRDDLFLDGVHPNRAGYQVMGECVLELCQAHFCQERTTRDKTG